MSGSTEHDLRVLVVVAVMVAAFSLFSQMLGCAHRPTYFGSRAPTQYTFQLTDEDLDEAARRDCEQTWYSGDHEADIHRAFKILREHHIRVAYWNPVSSGTALSRTLYLTGAFDSMDPEQRARLLRHELTHYCDRQRLGAMFDARYLHSAGRWVLETRAYAQSVRAMVAAGWRTKLIEDNVDLIVQSMRDDYWLHDIDPEQFGRETRRILLNAAYELPGHHVDEPAVPWP